jgi:hypothetical protein
MLITPYSILGDEFDPLTNSLVVFGGYVTTQHLEILISVPA